MYDLLADSLIHAIDRRWPNIIGSEDWIGDKVYAKTTFRFGTENFGSESYVFSHIFGLRPKNFGSNRNLFCDKVYAKPTFGSGSPFGN